MKTTVRVLFMIGVAYLVVGAPALTFYVLATFLVELSQGRDIAAVSHFAGNQLGVMWVWLVVMWLMLRPWPASVTRHLN